MSNITTPIGLWIPLVTPFNDGELDEVSLRRLITHYAQMGISGIILAATTGEGQLLSDAELEQLVKISASALAEESTVLPLYLGVSRSDPLRLIKQVETTNTWPIDGHLISGPNYLRPSQEGVFKYYQTIAGSTDKLIIIYNIPYRTGVNIDNETMLALAETKNIVGVKDCCGSAEQSYELIRNAPEDFSVMTGEDPFFYNAFSHGAPGAIVTGAHVLADVHLEIIDFIKEGNHREALARWNCVTHIPRLLFAEPNPAPLKYWLWKDGLIKSAEVRLPFMPVSTCLANKIDKQIEREKKS